MKKLVLFSYLKIVAVTGTSWSVLAVRARKVSGRPKRPSGVKHTQVDPNFLERARLGVEPGLSDLVLPDVADYRVVRNFRARIRDGLRHAGAG